MSLANEVLVGGRWGASTLLVAISHVVVVRAEPQVCRVAAAAVVAGMEDEQTGGDVAVGQDPRLAMGAASALLVLSVGLNIVKVRPADVSELDSLMDAAAYEAYVHEAEEGGH